MRCTNCGWPNPPQATKCAKCGSNLSAAPASGPVINEPSGNYPPAGNNDANLNETVFEQHPMGGNVAPSQPSNPEANSTSTCPKCGYPLRPGISNCPNCNFKLGNGVAASEPQYHHKPGTPTNHRPTSMDAGAVNINPIRTSHGAHGGTVNPYMMNYQAAPAFTLKPLKRFNERHELEEHEYEGSETVLNRDNTEPGNGSITSKEQAIITHEGDNWYIQDRSEQKTTFVQCGNKHELHDGDLILLGNRLFEFHEC